MIIIKYLVIFKQILALLIITLLHLTPLSVFHNKPGSTSFGLAIISVLTFWHNILMQKIGYFNYTLNIYWSLSVEEIFYLAFPLSCVLFKKSNRLIFFWVLLIILAPIYRHVHANDEIVALYGYISCFDGIAIGCCAAMIADHIANHKYAFLSDKFWKILQILAIMASIATCFYSDIKLLWMILFFLLSAFTAGIIARFYSLPLNKQLRRLFFNFR